MTLKKITGIIVLSGLVSACDNPLGKDKYDTADSGKKQYIVVMKRSAARGLSLQSLKLNSQSLASRHGTQFKKLFVHSLYGGVIDATADQVTSLKGDPEVAYIEEDQVVSIRAVQPSAPWGLDRIDQIGLPLSDSYEYQGDGTEVNAYVIDTGILNSHSDFEGRAQNGWDAVDNDSNSNDCEGHGSHVAGTIGGKTYGVAKKVNLIGVRVLDCRGSGTYSNVIEGVEWVTANHVKPALANMSLGGGASQALDEAIKASVAAGVTYIVAAGNSSRDACQGSPARIGEVLTVGASTKDDKQASFSNYGSCLDLYAPGKDINSVGISSNSSSVELSGTSMASPHVAGVVALYLEQNPLASPAEVAEALLDGSLSGKLSSLGSGSPNKLLNNEFLIVEEPEEPEEPDEGGEDKLDRGKPLLDLAGTQGEQTFYQLDISEHASNIEIKISGGSGDADLYVKDGEAPNVSSYDCRPYLNGNDEVCQIDSSASGKLYLMIRGYRAYSGVKLEVDYESTCD